MKRLALSLLLPLLVCACGYGRVPAGSVDVGGLQVRTPIEWSKKTYADHDLWTRDGHVLQELWFVKGLDDGDALIPPVPGRAEDLPKYDASMTLLEVPDFVEASLSAQGFQQIELRNIRPQKFGTRDGVAAKLDFLTKDGLRKSGRFIATKHDKDLYLVMYTGVAGHYFDAYSDDAAKIMSSVSTDF